MFGRTPRPSGNRAPAGRRIARRVRRGWVSSCRRSPRACTAQGSAWPNPSRARGSGYGAPMTTVDANGVALGIEAFGEDGAPLVLLAGGTTMLSWPDALCERLVVGGRRVVRYDLRGGSRRKVTGVPGGERWCSGDMAGRRRPGSGSAGAQRLPAYAAPKAVARRARVGGRVLGVRVSAGCGSRQPATCRREVYRFGRGGVYAARRIGDPWTTTSKEAWPGCRGC